MEEEVVKHSMVGLKMFPSPAARAVSCGGLKHSLQQKKGDRDTVSFVATMLKISFFFFT